MHRNIIDKKISSKTIISAQKNVKNNTKEQSFCAQYNYSYNAQAYTHSISESPLQTVAITESNETIPIDIFSQHASAMQAISRYLVDTKQLGFTDAARILGRNPKSIWSSYHQTKKFNIIDEKSLRIPVSIFLSNKSPLEAIVVHLKSKGLRNIEIARTLKLNPKTIWTAIKRAEVRT